MRLKQRTGRTRWAGGVLLLLLVAAAGCTDHHASGQESPAGSGPPAATISDVREGLSPGDQRTPGAATATTARPRTPIARTSSPAVTTSSTTAAPTAGTTPVPAPGP
jgi:hypothetical protein